MMHNATKRILQRVRTWHGVRKIGKWRFVLCATAATYAVVVFATGLFLILRHNTDKIEYPAEVDVLVITIGLAAGPVLSLLCWLKEEERYKKYAAQMKST